MTVATETLYNYDLIIHHASLSTFSQNNLCLGLSILSYITRKGPCLGMHQGSSQLCLASQSLERLGSVIYFGEIFPQGKKRGL